MAAINDNDLEMLEAFLDEELSDEQRDQMRRRLAADNALSGELERMRADREARQAIFKSLEGGEEAVVDRAMNQIKALERDRKRRMVHLRRFMYGAAAAACITIGFLVGWMGSFGGKATVSAGEPYRVEILDESGQTLAVQKFQTLDKAREFSNDLQQWQVRQERLLRGQVTRYSDRF